MTKWYAAFSFLFLLLFSAFNIAAYAADTTPPTGAISVNNNAVYATTRAVTLTLSAKDNTGGSGISQMQLSNNGSKWLAAEPYATTKAWTLATANGVKKVYVKYKDNAGNWSGVYSSTIILDTKPPRGKIKINNGASIATTIDVTLNLFVTDAGSGVAEMQFSNDSINWSMPESYTPTRAWALSPGNGKKVVYAKYIDDAGNCSKVFSDKITLKAPAGAEGILAAEVITGTQSTPATHVGLYNPGTSVFYLKNTHSGGNADITFAYGAANAGWLPISGDWNGDGIDTIGLYSPQTATFYLRNSNTTGVADITFTYGDRNAGWLPIAGDWNKDGIDTIGLYNPTTSVFYLRNSNSAGYANLTFPYGPGNAGWKPIAGDWNGDGTDTIGLYNPVTSIFYLKNVNTAGYADLTFAYGPANVGWKPVAGDWNSDGIDTIGLYSPPASAFFLRNTNTVGIADLTFGYGPPGSGWLSIVGNWNTASTPVDTTPPTGSILINNGAASTGTTSVTLNLSATDAGSGMGTGAEMRFSNDNINWSTPDFYVTTKAWALTSGNGIKTVYVKFKDVKGNWSGTFSDTIVLSTTTPPTITITDPVNGAVINAEP